MQDRENFVIEFKKQILFEFKENERKGIYAFTQKNMAYNSNRIEGSTLTSEQTASLFDTGTLYSDKEIVYKAKDIEEMTGHFKMFNEVLKTLGLPLSQEMIKAFHYQLKSGVFEDIANGRPIGEYKTRANIVSDIQTELPENVIERIESLIREYESSEKGLIDIVKFHAIFEHIHPFVDGNGRTGRAILFKQCLEQNIVPIIINDEDKTKYYHSLHKAQIEKDYASLEAFFIEEQEKYYQKAKAYIICEKDFEIEM